MIAEIKGKISRTGSNLNERLEDQLTGNFFGTLRYIPFNKCLKEIFVQGVYPKNVAKYIEQINEEEYSEHIEFWPYDQEGEIDVLLNFDNCIIGIEVKYLSGISSDDGIDNKETSLDEENIKSNQQLARESRIISKKGLNKNKVLLFLAKEDDCKQVYTNTKSRNIVEDDVHLGYISWQSILEILENIKLDNQYEKVMINDLKELLIKKGFEQFKSFNLDSNDIKVDWYNFGKIKREIISFDKDIDLIIEENWYEFKTNKEKILV